MQDRFSFIGQSRRKMAGGGLSGANSIVEFPARTGQSRETHPVPSLLAGLQSLSLNEIDLQYSPDFRAVWCVQRHTERPNFTNGLINDIRAIQGVLKSMPLNPAEAEAEFRYLIWASSKQNIFNMGGDLIYFVKLLKAKDRDGMAAYAQACVDICHSNYMNCGQPLTTIALVEGDALGGGFESALSSDILVAEKSAQFGFPEILFGLFPGMGAYSFLCRRAGQKLADELIYSGRILRGEQLHDLGIVDVLAEDGEGEQTLEHYLKKNGKRRDAHAAIRSISREVQPVSREEMEKIASRWVDVAMRLDDKDIKKMHRLAQAQARRLGRSTDPDDVESEPLRPADVEAPSPPAASSVNGKTSQANSGNRVLNYGSPAVSIPFVNKERKQVAEKLSDTKQPTDVTAQATGKGRPMTKQDSGASFESRAKSLSGSEDGSQIYSRLMEEVAEARAAATLQPGVERLLSDGMDREEYLEFLEQLYHVVWHFCPTMAAAAARCDDNYRELRFALYESIADEKGHEQWVLEDVAAMGGDVEAVRRSIPAVPVQAMIGHNYYVAEHRNPWSVMGMVHVLEEISMNYSARVARVVAKNLDITDGSGFKFLGSHGTMDIGHVDEFKTLVRHANREEDISAIVESAKVNYALFGALFKDA